MHSLGARTHDDDDFLGIRSPDVVEEVVLATNDLGELVHHVLHNRRASQVKRIHRLATLEVNVRILGRAAQHRMVRRKGALTMRPHQVVVDHGAHVVEVQLFDLGHFMRGAEAVKEMQEGKPRFQRGCVRNQRQVHRFLNRVRRQHGKSRLAGCHRILVVAEDRKRLRRDGAGSDVNHRAGQLAGNLVHIRDHQQQALRRREGRAQRARLECPMQGSGGAAFALHFDDLGNRAPNVLLADRRPCVR